MEITGTRGARAMVLAAVAGLLVAGCGAQRPGGVEGGAVVTPSALLDVPCPGETPTAPPLATRSAPQVAPTDHYAENHGFMVPFPLHGKERCAGLDAVRRVEGALEPLRRRGDFDAQAALDALTGLGYSAGKVQSVQDGPTGVSFLVDDYPVCVEGTLDRAAARADAFGGYPDHPGCDRPTGGH